MNETIRPAGAMAALRAATATIHEATEALPLMQALLAADGGVEAYRRHLAALHLVYARVEPALYARCSPSLLERLGIAAKLPALASDLADLGIAPLSPSDSPSGSPPGSSSDSPSGSPPGSPSDSPPGSPSGSPSRGGADASGLSDALASDEAAALGGLYVLEGATLGGHVIARRLRQRWGAAAATLPFAFLEAGGVNPGVGWRRFGTGLEEWVDRHDGGDPARVVAGAVAVFAFMHEALREADYSHPQNLPYARPGTGE